MKRFIGDEDKIREITGYGVGELYETNTSQKIECSKESDAKILDAATFNFHLYPKDKEIASKISGEIGSLRKEVKDYLIKEKGCEAVSGNTIPKEKNEENMIYISEGAGKQGGTGELHGLFKFILAKKNNIKYELNFMRFFIDRENKVNCILKEIQFDRCMDDSVNYDQGKCKVCYPTSRQSQAACCDKIIEKNSKESLKSFCYNPPISFYDTADNIAETFIRFINDCDKWSHANNK